jgi:hypothetical protein
MLDGDVSHSPKTDTTRGTQFPVETRSYLNGLPGNEKGLAFCSHLY